MPAPPRTPRRRFLAALLGCVAAPALVGCGGGVSTNPDGRHARGELHVALRDDGKSLDPHRVSDAASMHLIENLYGTLFRYAPAYGEIEPDLAERVDVSPDGLTYTIRLRRDATFHSGRPVVAADVAYSIERIRELEVRAAHFAAVERIETPDDGTAVLRLKEPSAPLLTYLAHPMNAIVDRGVVEASGGRLDRVAAGSGPFRLVEWRKEQHLVLERHPRYHHAGLPKLERLVYLPMSDPTARSTALRNGEIDLILDVAPKDARVLEGAPGVRVESTPGTFWEYVGINTSRPPLDDVRVRRAIAWAVDRAALDRVVKLGGATVLPGGHIPPSHWAHANLELYPRRDVDKARALLAEAGHAGGVDLELKVGSSDPYQIAAAQMVKQQLAEAGIRVRLLAQEPTVFFAALGAGEFQLTVVGWVGFVDPDEWLYELFHSDGAYNQQAYANPRVDALLAQGRATADRGERKRIYAEAQRIVADEAPMAFLYANDQASAMGDRVRGFVVHPTASTIFLRGAWLEPAAAPLAEAR